MMGRLPAERDEYVLTYVPARGLPFKLRIELDEARGTRYRWWIEVHGVPGC